MAQVVKLLLRFAEHVRGYLLLQINPKYAYDTNKVVATAERKAPLSSIPPHTPLLLQTP